MSGPVHLGHLDEDTWAGHLWKRRGPMSEWAAGGYAVEPGTDPETLPRIALLLIGDGRDELREQTCMSFLSQVYGYRLGYVVEVDDRQHRMGFGGAIRTGWHYLAMALRDASLEGTPPPFDYVFHLEEDWLFLEAIDLRWLAAMLAGSATPKRSALPTLAQAALKRGPVNSVERKAGGLVEQWPEEYADSGTITPEAGGVPYLTHRLFFTTNPSLYRASLMTLGWPEGPASERAFTELLLSLGYSFGYYGAREHPPTVEHLGAVRTGLGY
jgi:hypothetical protein